ncbi:MAG: hypothetical protein QW840_02865, partial [Candidatus Bathyarchaeia archaeon]
MIEYIPDLFYLLISLAVMFVAVLLYKRTKKPGLVFIAFGFLFLAIPYIIDLALGGPYFYLNLEGAGYDITYIGMVSMYRFIFSLALHVVFAILVMIGLAKLS